MVTNSTAVERSRVPFGARDLLRLFDLGLTTMPLTFRKRIAVALGARADDVTDEGEVADTTSVWQGLATLNHRYSACTPNTPTPVLSTFFFLASGLGAAGILRSRRKK